MKLNIKKIIIILLQILAIIGVIFYYKNVLFYFASLNLGVWYQNGSDFIYYKQFFDAFPILYETIQPCNCYVTVYLPYFYWIFYPFANMMMYEYYLLFFKINIISYIIALSIVIWKKNAILITIALITSTSTLFNIVTWGNWEAIVFLVMTIITFTINDKNSKYFAILYGIFLFKIVSVIFYLIFLWKLKEKRNRIRFIIISLITIILLNLYFIILNPQLLNPLYDYNILSNTGFDYWNWGNNPLYTFWSMMHRETSFALGFFFIVYLGCYLIYNKYYKKTITQIQNDGNVLIGMGIFVFVLYIIVLNSTISMPLVMPFFNF